MSTVSHAGQTEPLQFLKDVFVRTIVSNRPDLTNRQMALLLTIYLNPLPHTVRGLASGLSLAKPVVSRALQHLELIGLLRRQKDLRDGRNMLVERTAVGAAFLVNFSDAL